MLREYFEALLIAVLLATFTRTFVVQAFKIPTASMEENLLIGDHILVNKFVYAPSTVSTRFPLLPQRAVRRGDVVVFRSPEDPGRDFVKRCVGLPGDRIEIIDKRLYINGRRVHDGDYVWHRDLHVHPASAERHRDNFGPFAVPENHLFFLGDNRDDSNDSRFLGPTPLADIKGRAFVVYWSFEAVGAEGEGGSSMGPPGKWDKLKRLSRAGASFFAHTRWRRTLHLVR